MFIQEGTRAGVISVPVWVFSSFFFPVLGHKCNGGTWADDCRVFVTS